MIRHYAPRLAVLIAAPLLLAALQPIPPLKARVTDLTGTLSAAGQSQLEAKLADFEARKGAQIAVLIVSSTAPEEIEQYSIRVVEAWELGREKPDDGALLLIAKDDRVLRIEVGRGLEGALTDLMSKRIIADTITPYFRQGDFEGGVDAGVEQMIRVVDGEPLPEPDAAWAGGPEKLAGSLPLLFGLIFVGSVVLRSLLGRALGAVATGAAAGTLAWWITAVLGLSVGIGVIGFIVSLMLGFRNGGRWSSRPGHGGWTSGGWGGGGGRSSGGFGGGGGSFGGGGASGRW